MVYVPHQLDSVGVDISRVRHHNWTGPPNPRATPHGVLDTLLDLHLFNLDFLDLRLQMSVKLLLLPEALL